MLSVCGVVGIKGKILRGAGKKSIFIDNKIALKVKNLTLNSRQKVDYFLSSSEK